MCDRVLVLEKGVLGFDGPVDEGIKYLHYDDDDDVNHEPSRGERDDDEDARRRRRRSPRRATAPVSPCQHARRQSRDELQCL